MDGRALTWTGMLLLATAAPVFAQGGGGAGVAPSFRLLVASVSGSYRDYSRSDAKGVEGHLGKTKLTGTEVQAAGSYQTWELELGSRQLTPDGLEWWSRRAESTVALSYYWPRFRFVQPVVGLTRVTQSGDQDHADAPPAFIDTNMVSVLGLKTSFVPYSFGTHGFLIQGRISYHTSFERVRNFGDEGYGGIGYVFATGRFKAALTARQMRSFFRAEKPEEPAELGYLTVRHVYVANRIGLYMEY